MQRTLIRWIVGGLGVLLLAGCAQPVSNPTPTLEEELPPPVTVPIPFNVPPTGPPTVERAPSLYLNPGAVSLQVGETATVQVWADGVGGIHALSVEIGFDPLRVQVVDADPATEGIQAARGDLMEVVLENRVEGDRLIYHAAVQPEAAAKDGGVVVSLSLRGVSSGATVLRVRDGVAQDGAGNPVAITPLSDGLVTVGGAAPSPEEPPPPVAETPIPSPLPPQPTVVATPMPSGAGGIYYVVERGENLFRIGIKFGTTAQAIAAANNIPDPRQVQAGTMIRIPVPAPGGGYGYYVRPGDTLYSIARRFGMTVEELATLNNVGPDFTIHTGTILKVVPRR